ncbi:MAG: aromatic ring-hydroxylating dioxygenase subunit alpha [Woeseiaceae bacterium]|nr:aromatic ring-hydroxylating dioxygenase subunit alpha [Woeseiaceae bacterium]
MTALNEIRTTLPSHWYFDPAHYERELEAIWYRDWICVGREESLPAPGDYFVAGIGSQSIIVTRDAAGELRAFHNTCRHRGSILCREPEGRFRNGRIICPYHTWTYSTDGSLLATPGRIESDGFDAGHFSLYDVHVASWRGFIHINLSDTPQSDLETQLGDEALVVANWPFESLRTVHREIQPVACNWKLFWENYSECYHCPRIHPELCRLMPVYRHAVLNLGDLPGWEPAHAGDTGRPRVDDNRHTWTFDGQSTLSDISGPTAEEIAAGVAFASFTASMFIVAHPDYVRTVRIVPTGPESIDLVAEWLLPADGTTATAEQLESILGLARTVMRQDAEVCELNQRGLHSRRHENGVLVAQEYGVWELHEWVRDRLAGYPSGD